MWHMWLMLIVCVTNAIIRDLRETNAIIKQRNEKFFFFPTVKRSTAIEPNRALILRKTCINIYNKAR